MAFTQSTSVNNNLEACDKSWFTFLHWSMMILLHLPPTFTKVKSINSSDKKFSFLGKNSSPMSSDFVFSQNLNYLNCGIVALEEVDRLIGLRLADHHTVVVLLVLHIPPS